MKCETPEQIEHPKEQMPHFKQHILQLVPNFAFLAHEVCLLHDFSLYSY